MVRIIAPDGGKIRDIRSEKLYSEVVVEDRAAKYFVAADGTNTEVSQVSLNGNGAGAVVDSTISTRLDELEEELAAAKILLGVE